MQTVDFSQTTLRLSDSEGGAEIFQLRRDQPEGVRNTRVVTASNKSEWQLGIVVENGQGVGVAYKK